MFNTQTTVHEIAEALDAFPRLASFDFDNVENAGPAPGFLAYSADSSALEAWSTHCPTLVTSRLREWSCLCAPNCVTDFFIFIFYFAFELRR
jgi:hypothetical protein